jgi:hypothetical protein
MAKSDYHIVLKELTENKKKSLTSKSAAQKALKKAGILTKSGNVSKPYKK